MKPHLAFKLLAIATTAMAPALTLAAPPSDERAAQATNTTPQFQAQASDALKPAPPTGRNAAPVRTAAPAPAGIGDILKMLDAGVSKEVIRIYVENSTVAYNLSAADIIALKEHGATDDITTALLKHGAELRARAPARAEVVAAGPGEAYRGPFQLDPEGYEYFHYYYLYPRTLASAYQQLAPYATWPYGYGGYPAYGPAYGPGFSLRDGRLRRFNLRAPLAR